MSSAAVIESDDLDTKQAKILSSSEYKSAVPRLGSISVEPYAPVVGAYVTGFRFDATRPVEEETRSFLYRSLLEFGFLSFAPGSVEAEDFDAFTKLFGSAQFAGNPQAPRSSETSQINTLDSRHKKTRTNYIWHIDQAYKPAPQKFTALYGQKVPATGGETIFANATVAFNLFDPLFAKYLETLTVVQDIDTQGLMSMAYANDDLAAARNRNPPLETPLIRVHPETGAKQIFATELYTQRILGLSRSQSDSLLAIIFEQIKLPEIRANYKWEEGAVLIWDNRTVQHRGVYNYSDQHRLLRRAVIS